MDCRGGVMPCASRLGGKYVTAAPATTSVYTGGRGGARWGGGASDVPGGRISSPHDRWRACLALPMDYLSLRRARGAQC